MCLDWISLIWLCDRNITFNNCYTNMAAILIDFTTHTFIGHIGWCFMKNLHCWNKFLSFFEVQRHQCQECRNDFASKRNLIKHENSVHKGELFIYFKFSRTLQNVGISQFICNASFKTVFLMYYDIVSNRSNNPFIHLVYRSLSVVVS